MIPIIATVLAALAAAVFLFQRYCILTAAPDEWLLRIRNGQLLESGIGVQMFWRPGDIFACFSSTIQRVGYRLECQTADRMAIDVEGFILWSVAAEADKPFLAFQSLGLANLLNPPEALGHSKHLLTRPQHKAFQQIVQATAQRLISRLPLKSLLSDQDRFVSQLAERLSLDISGRGVRINQVEVLKLRAAEGEIVAALGAKEELEIREQAESLRRENAERTANREREKRLREARAEAEARRDQEVHEAEAKLEKEQQKAKLLEQEKAVELLEIEKRAAVLEREQALKHEQALRDEARSLALQEQRIARQRQGLDFELEKQRRRAEVERDAEMAKLAVDNEKSQSQRDHELACLTAEKLSKTLNIKDARWVTVGENPAASLGLLFEGLRDLTQFGKSAQ